MSTIYCFMFSFSASYLHLIVFALDETSILVAVQFSMQNIYESYDLDRALWQRKVDVHQLRSLFTDFCVTLSRIAMTLSAGVSPLGCSETSVEFDLITNIQKTSRVRC